MLRGFLQRYCDARRKVCIEQQGSLPSFDSPPGAVAACDQGSRAPFQRLITMKAMHLLSALLLGGALAYAARGEAITKPSLRLVDDRGQPIHASLEVCFQIGTRNDCSTLSTGGPVELPADWAGVRVEGPEHGPVSMKRGDLKPGLDGLAVLLVPRKADLQVVAEAKERITVSLYPQDDPTFRSPSFRSEAQGGKSI